MKLIKYTLFGIFLFLVFHSQIQSTPVYLYVKNGTSFVMSANVVVSLSGNLINNGSVFTKNPASDTDTLKFIGNSIQEISGTGVNQYKNLKIINSAGLKLLNTVNNVTVKGILVLKSGPLNLNSRLIIIDNASTGAITRTDITPGTGYIISETYDNSSGISASIPANTCTSRVQWNINTGTGNYSIPFGTSGGTYIPFVCNVTSAATGSGNLTVSTYNTSTANYPYAGYPSNVTNMIGNGGDNSTYVVDRFWSVAFNNFSSAPTSTLSFYYDAANDLNGLTATSLKAQYWDGTGWSLPIMGTGNNPNYVNAISGVNFSGVWVLVNNENPLPVELVDFTANCNDNKVMIMWSTASENNNDYFTIDRCVDSENWETIAMIEGMGNSNSLQNYSFIDVQPYSSGGLEAGVYYRLKQTDFDGAFTYSEIIYTFCDKLSFGNISIYPNPAIDNFNCDILSNENTTININITNALGQNVIIKKNDISEGENHLLIDISKLIAAPYFIKIETLDGLFKYGKEILVR